MMEGDTQVGRESDRQQKKAVQTEGVELKGD